MSGRKPLPAVLAAVAIVLSAVLAGCGGDLEGASPWVLTTTADTAPADADADADTAADGPRFSSTGELLAAVNEATRRAGSYSMSASIDGTGIPDPLQFEGSVKRGAEPAMRVRAGRTELVVIGDDVYLAPGKAIRGRHWIRMDPHAKDAASKQFADVVERLRAEGEFTLDEKLLSALEFAYVGTDNNPDDPDGEPWEVYALRSEGRDLIDLLEKQGRLPEGTGSSPELADAEATYEFTVDEHDRPVTLSLKIEGPAYSMSMFTRMKDWGKDLKIPRPKKSDTWKSAQVTLKSA